MSPADSPRVPRTALRGFMQSLLASILSDKGRATEAIAHGRAALEKLEGILGPDHPELQLTLEGLARDLISLEDYAAAAPILRRTYDYLRSHLGSEHPETLERLAVLTECLLLADQAAAAQPLLQHQLSVYERLRGPEHEDTLTTVLLLSEVYEKIGDRRTLEELLRRAHDGFERSLGPTHPKTLVSIYKLFENLKEGPEAGAADIWGEKLFSISLQVHGATHPLTTEAAKLVACHYCRQKKVASGIDILRRALAAFPADSSPPGLEQLRLRRQLAASLDLAGKIAEAKALMRGVARGLQKHLGRGDTEVDHAYQYWADLLGRTLFGRFYFRCLRTLASPFRNWPVTAKLFKPREADRGQST